MKQVRILLVEDNEGDIVLTLEALEESKFSSIVDLARNGQQALDHLLRNEGYEQAAQPDLILLDINLPLVSGHEVLSEIKTNEQLKHIPVIMLTTSSSAKDIKKAYGNHANCYICKPAEINDFVHVIEGIEHFWFSICSLQSSKLKRLSI